MPRVTIADEVTFVTNDKRAQYARLVVYNHGIKLGGSGDVTDAFSLRQAR